METLKLYNIVLTKIQQIITAVAAFSKLLDIATTDLRITGSTHPIFLDLVKLVIENFRGRGLINPRNSLAQSFANILPGVLLTTELEKQL